MSMARTVRLFSLVSVLVYTSLFAIISQIPYLVIVYGQTGGNGTGSAMGNGTGSAMGNGTPTNETEDEDVDEEQELAPGRFGLNETGGPLIQIE
jgi:hypothetical protein